MNFLMHLMSHRVLQTHQKNMEKIQERLHAHRANHDVEEKMHQRAMFLQEQLHQAMKVHSFKKAISDKMEQAQRMQSEKRASDLIQKLSRIESEEKKLAGELSQKTKLHAALTVCIGRLEKEVDDVLSSVKKASK